MCSQLHFNVSDKNEIMPTCGNLQKSIHIQLPMHAQPVTQLQNRSQWFPRIKPIDVSCSQKWKQCKTHDSWHPNRSNSISQVQILSSPKSSKTLKFPQNDDKRANKNFQDISKLQIHSNLSLTALSLCTAFCIFHCDCRSSLLELSVTTQLKVRQRSRRGNLWYTPL